MKSFFQNICEQIMQIVCSQENPKDSLTLIDREI